MTTFESSKLANGVVPDTKTAVASPSGVKWLIHELNFSNITALPVSIQVFYNDGISKRQYAFDLPGDDSVSLAWGGNGFVIEDGETLEAQASIAAAINYSIDGAIRTP